jgi:uncharacterized membrane protein YeaQ/YmgE (transglycosylase-associated protein family)
MTFLTWILAGVLAGLLAGWVLKRGGFGLNWDITLGLVGSIGGSWILRSLGFYPDAGIPAKAVIAFMVRSSRSSLSASSSPSSFLLRRRTLSGGGAWAPRSWPSWPG